MRYEALFPAAFVVGLLGAMSQQSVSPPVRQIHNTLSAPSATANQVVIPIGLAPMTEKAVAEAGAPITAKEVAAAAKPVKRVAKLARKAKPKQEVAAAAPPEPSHRSFWYRLFHKTPDTERVATADTKS